MDYLYCLSWDIGHWYIILKIFFGRRVMQISKHVAHATVYQYSILWLCNSMNPVFYTSRYTNRICYYLTSWRASLSGDKLLQKMLVIGKPWPTLNVSCWIAPWDSVLTFSLFAVGLTLWHLKPQHTDREPLIKTPPNGLEYHNEQIQMPIPKWRWKRKGDYKTGLNISW